MWRVLREGQGVEEEEKERRGLVREVFFQEKRKGVP